MKVKILKSTVADFHRVEVGQVYDLSDRDAEILIRAGKAVKHVPLKKRISKVKKHV